MPEHELVQLTAEEIHEEMGIPTEVSIPLLIDLGIRLAKCWIWYGSKPNETPSVSRIKLCLRRSNNHLKLGLNGDTLDQLTSIIHTNTRDPVLCSSFLRTTLDEHASSFVDQPSDLDSSDDPGNV